MIRFLKSFFLLLIVPIIFLYGLVEFLLRQIPNDYAYKNKWLSEHASSLKILSIGASQGYYGINPEYFSQKAFNEAHVSQTLNYDAFLVNKFIPKCDSLQFLIIPLSYSSLFSSLDYTIEYWRAKNYNIYYGCTYHRFEPKFNLLFYDDNLLSSIKRVYYFYKHGDNDIRCNELGYGLNFSSAAKYKDWEKSGASAAKRHTLISENSRYIENLGYLNQIINTCKNRNIEIILLNTPVWHTYSSCLDNKQLQLIFTTCQKLQEQNKNVSYINMFYDKRFIANDFFDADHLNEFGAKKLTEILDSTIKKN